MDLDGDGALSMFELEFFYEEQARRLEARAVEPLPFRDLACQVLDLVQPQTPGELGVTSGWTCGPVSVTSDPCKGTHDLSVTCVPGV